MVDSAHRAFKVRLYGQYGRIGKALASPNRLELLELLAQGDRSVESLATEIDTSTANASRHLQVLRQAGLVETRRDGLFIHYRLSDPSVLELCRAIRVVAERRLAELDLLVRDHFRDRKGDEAVSIDELLARAKRKEVVVLDTRPAGEYAAGHIPGALSVPVDQLQAQLRRLPKHREYVGVLPGAVLCVCGSCSGSPEKERPPCPTPP